MRQHSIMRLLLVFCVVLTLTACGRPDRSSLNSPALTASAAQVSKDRLPREVQVTAPNFGEADPHPWEGRSPSAYAVHGIDTSRWNGTVDWAKAQANGVNFAFLKATEGGDLVDPEFAANWRASRAAGVPVGAYHFWYHCRPAAEQARWFIRHVPRAPKALPPVLDMEWTPFSPTCTRRPSPDAIRREAKVFLDMIEAHYGQRPLIYSTPDFFETNQMWKLGGYEFWLRSVAGHPRDVYQGRHWTFWQYTGTGLVPGVQGKSDINVFAGSRADWAAWLAARQR